MSAIQLIATDLDGTFLGGHSELLPENASAFRSAAETGIPVCICSGRCPVDIGTLQKEMGLTTWSIAFNGAMIRTPAGEDIYSHPMEKDTLLKVLLYAESTGIYFQTCLPGTRYLYGPGVSQERLKRSAAHLTSRGVRCIQVNSWREIPEKALDNCMKIIISGETLEEGDFLRRSAAEQNLPVTVTSSWFNNIEIVADGVDKGKAILMLCNHLGISPENVMVFGDQKNDLSMLKVVGWPVVMANGDEETKRTARILAPANTESGVAAIVREYVLNR